MKTLFTFASLLLFATLTSAAQSVPLAWDPVAGASGYRVYASSNSVTPGTGSWQVSQSVTNTTATVTNLANGNWAFYVTAVVTNKLESLPSAVVTTPVPVPVTVTPTSVRLNFSQPVQSITITVP